MGTLTFGAGPAGVTDAGTFTAAAGGTLDVGGTRTEAVGATVAGAGTVDITGRTTFSASDNLTNTGRFEVDGTLAAASGVTVTTANLLLNGGTGGVLDGPGTVAAEPQVYRLKPIT